ncbi:MAG: hypothetical protein NC088_08275 [Bacteroides sp.]|nr:hypothetical protein [Bacteroides sp.]
MKIKRIIPILIVLVLILGASLFFIMKKNNSTNTGNNTLVYPDEHGGMYGAATPDGVFYVYIKNNGYLDYFIRFIDYETGQDIAVCNKPECSHDTKDCNAFVCRAAAAPDNKMAFDLFMFNNKLYITVREGDDDASGVSSMSLYEQDFDGENRKHLFTLDHELFQQIVTFENTIIFSTAYTDKTFMKQFEGKDMSQVTDEDYEEMQKHNCNSLWSYNTETEELVRLQESFGEREKEYAIEYIIASDDSQGFYYVTTFGIDRFQSWYYYDIASNTYEEIMTDFSSCGIYSKIRIYNKKLYYCDKDTGDFCCYDINTGAITKLAALDNYTDSFISDDKLFWNLGYGEDTDYAKTYQRWVYFDYKKEKFYIAKEGGHYPIYSSGEKGIVDYTDYYSIDTLQLENDAYDYQVTDMNHYYKSCYKEYENEYADALLIAN